MSKRRGRPPEEPAQPKRGRGRPRKQPAQPKRGRGRPRKQAEPAPRRSQRVASTADAASAVHPVITEPVSAEYCCSRPSITPVKYREGRTNNFIPLTTLYGNSRVSLCFFF